MLSIWSNQFLSLRRLLLMYPLGGRQQTVSLRFLPDFKLGSSLSIHQERKEKNLSQSPSPFEKHHKHIKEHATQQRRRPSSKKQ